MFDVFAGGLSSVALLVQLAIAIILVRKYLVTRDVAFIWLGLAVAVWPLLSLILDVGAHAYIERIARHGSVGFYPFTLVENGQITSAELTYYVGVLRQVIGVGLLLVAVLTLCKTKADRARIVVHG
jgi:hypothetical protein